MSFLKLLWNTLSATEKTSFTLSEKTKNASAYNIFMGLNIHNALNNKNIIKQYPNTYFNKFYQDIPLLEGATANSNLDMHANYLLCTNAGTSNITRVYDILTGKLLLSIGPQAGLTTYACFAIYNNYLYAFTSSTPVDVGIWRLSDGYFMGSKTIAGGGGISTYPIFYNNKLFITNNQATNRLYRYDTPSLSNEIYEASANNGIVGNTALLDKNYIYSMPFTSNGSLHRWLSSSLSTKQSCVINNIKTQLRDFAIDNDNAYVIDYGSPSRIHKIRLSDFTYQSYIELPAGYAPGLGIKNTGEYLTVYIGSATNKILTLERNNFSIISEDNFPSAGAHRFIHRSPYSFIPFLNADTPSKLRIYVP